MAQVLSQNTGVWPTGVHVGTVGRTARSRIKLQTYQGPALLY
jgi:hypothetical protein